MRTLSDTDTNTSSDKMASLFLSSEEMQGIYGLSGVISEKLIEILCRRDNEDHANLTKLINSSFTKSALVEARRKIFDFAVAREKEKRALATARGDALIDETAQCSDVHMLSIEQWDLDNRGNKPKIANDIAALSLYIEDPGESFPTAILAKPTPKTKSTKKRRTAERNISSSSSEDCTIDDPATVSNKPDKQQDPVEIQKTFERFVIKEVCGAEIDPSSANDDIAVSITALKNASTSTHESVSQRSIGVQTHDIAASTPSREIGPCLRCSTCTCPESLPLNGIPISAEPLDSAVSPSPSVLSPQKRNTVVLPPMNESHKEDTDLPLENPLGNIGKSSVISNANPISTSTTDLINKGSDLSTLSADNNHKASVNKSKGSAVNTVSCEGSAEVISDPNLNACSTPEIRPLVNKSNGLEIPSDSENSTETVDKTDNNAALTENCALSLSANPSINLNNSLNSDTSLLEYIDFEFESVKKRNMEMRAAKRDDRPKNEQDRRIVKLEASCERLSKRLDFVEKDHTREICEIKAEQRRLNYMNAGDTPNITQTQPRYRRHSSSELDYSIRAYAPPPAKHSIRNNEYVDDSWDVNDSSVFVATQDSQGQAVMTRATPVHMKELRQNSNTLDVGSKSATKCDNPAPNACTANPPSESPTVHIPVVNANKVKFVDGMKDIPAVAPLKLPQVNRAPKGQRAAPTTSRPSNTSSKQVGNTKGSSTNVNQRPSDIQHASSTDSSSETDSDNNNAAKRAKLSTSIDHGNDRPKGATSTPANVKGNDAVHSVESVNESDNSINEKESYAQKASKKATREQWTTVGKNEKNKKRSVPPLKGLVNSENSEMFIKGLKRADFRDRKELEESVRLFCEGKGINLIHHRVLAFKSTRATVGCKVVVSNDDAKSMMKKNFWPPGVWAREWLDEDPTEKNQATGNDKSLSEDSA